MSALNEAAAKGDTATIKNLIDRGVDLSVVDYDKRTALHLAAEEGHTNTVILLLSYGVDPNTVDRWGNTPLDCAESNFHKTVISVLRSKGAKNAEELSLHDDPPGVGAGGVAAVFTDERFIQAAAEGKLQTLISMLKSNPELLNTTDYDGRTALHLACEEGHLEIVQHLVSANADLGVKDRWGSTPLLGAIRNTHNDIADLLLDHGAVQERHEPVSAATYLHHAKEFFEEVAKEAGLPQSDVVPILAMRKHLEEVYGLEIDTHSVLKKEIAAITTSCKAAQAMRFIADSSSVYFKQNPPPTEQVTAWPLFADFVLSQVPGYTPQEDREFLIESRTLADCVLKRFTIGNWEAFVNNLKQIVEEVLAGENEGETAQYIPELKNANPDLFAVSVCTVDGQRCHFGDYKETFSVQSVGKTFTYSQALTALGKEKVHKHVGQEPSGRAFNDFALTKRKVPFNPVTNSGAIVTCSLLNPEEEDVEKRLVPFKQFLSDMAGGVGIGDCMDVFVSEQQSAFRNYALANHMKAAGAFDTNIDSHERICASVDFYLRVCSSRVSTPILATIASTYANYGVCPLNGKTCLRESVVKQTLQILASCGMYDYSGEWACTIGMPAKSGVSGVIFVVIPGVLGMSVFSPKLDVIGNSVRGIKLCQAFSEKFRYSVLDLLFRQTEVHR
eukprot:TRINITY_DN42101_c0_g1_i1.p1 TRINITY_DN42101_c0_g1~~TRINITY_DN42101_c0_g1_i1.p1  ORF type:complete len:731 (+),score=271.48 TRINITY_DN42101_c0_g1_i1:178-2193(+)